MRGCRQEIKAGICKAMNLAHEFLYLLGTYLYSRSNFLPV